MPNVSYTEDTLKVYFNPIPHDYSKDYFTIVVTVGGDVTWTGTGNNALYYSKDNGTTWSEPGVNITLSVNEGDKVLWKGGTSPTNNGIGKFSGGTDVRYTVEGNVMSLLFGDDFKGQTSLGNKTYVFYRLFYDNKNITSAEKLLLPATTLESYCYEYMFSGCTSLVTAPELPATTLESYCYAYMFSSCTSLASTPELPAKTLNERCYNYMFKDCTSLVTVSKLPATGLRERCYSYMFSGCTSLASTPELPATRLGLYCYENMFQGCSNLVTAPKVLPATTLADGCYENMFQGCSNLVTAPELPATSLKVSCYNKMFRDCTSLVTAPELPATTLTTYCYNNMFSGCTKLNYIKCLATTNISALKCLTDWVTNVASSGTFVKAAEMEDWPTGTSGIPTGWTVVDA